jgi:2-polyprenyl-3-methyl-5-hydroxy-6-metoxy-1,4-benzoquinol methylase
MDSAAVFQLVKYCPTAESVPQDLRALYAAQAKYRPFVDALGELHDYTGEALPEIIAKFKFEEVLKQDWPAVLKKGVAKGSLDEFYSTTRGFIYDCMANHTRAAQLELLGKIADICNEHHCVRVIDYGGGVGTLVILLKRLGLTVHYLDVAGETARFAQWRFTRRGLEIPVLTAEADISGLKPDGIISLEVLEHILDPEALIKRFYEALKPQGLLIISAAFHALGHVSHLRENVKYAGDNFLRLMTESGFALVDKYPGLPAQVFIKQGLGGQERRG